MLAFLLPSRAFLPFAESGITSVPDFVVFLVPSSFLPSLTETVASWPPVSVTLTEIFPFEATFASFFELSYRAMVGLGSGVPALTFSWAFMPGWIVQVNG